MTENKFLNLVLTEGIIMLSLGMCMLILPKITMISFGFMMCLAYIVYGGYMAINAFLSRHFSRHYILDVIIGLLLCIIGILLFILPVFDITVLIGLAGVYFILKCISTFAFSVQTQKILSFWWTNMLLSALELLFGLILIILLPSAALWLVGILTGFDFILSGIIFINMYIGTTYLREG